jgi:SAM-dependent methyltransferase
VRSPFIVSGWLIAPPGEGPARVDVEIDGEVRASTVAGLRRSDVEEAWPEESNARWSGFATEVFADDLDGRTVTVEVSTPAGAGRRSLARWLAAVEGLDGVVPPRARAWRLADVLACPQCGGTLDEADDSWRCRSCGARCPTRRGVPVLAPEAAVVESRLLETHPTNPNGPDQTAIIVDPAHALVLDLGAGNPHPREHYPNVVFHEWVHYPFTDVVSLHARLPYRDDVFDAVISKATFEHLARPWETADEVYRVLKPGGLVHVDTAFMQPLHGDPQHFFNMTLDGVREIFRRFAPRRCGVKPYQTPAYALRMQIGALLEHVRSDAWRGRLRAFDELLGEDFDRELDDRGRERLAAGVFFEGVKPRDGE